MTLVQKFPKFFNKIYLFFNLTSIPYTICMNSIQIFIDFATVNIQKDNLIHNNNFTMAGDNLNFRQMYV